MNAILPVESTEVALIPTALVPAQVYAPGGIEQILDQLERDVRKQAEALDASTPKGRAALKKLSNKVASSKVALDTMGKDLTEAIRLQKDGVDADRRSVRQRLDALRDEVKQPVEAYEQIERDRVADHQSALRQIEQCASLPVDQHAWTMEAIERREAELAVVFARNWQEFAQPATKAREFAAESLADVRAQLVREAKERAEQERFAAQEAEFRRVQAEKDRQEREARIAAEAAEKARRDAEAKAERERQETLRAAAEERARVEREAQAEQRRVEAERQAAHDRAEETERRRVADAAAAKAREEVAARKAETDRVVAEQKAERDREAAVAAERARHEAERKRQAAEAEALRAADERRAANHEHRRRINQSIMVALAICGLTEEQSQVVIAAVVRGQVPNMKVDY